jgi:tetratricopeptide (TPR) repeat protein
MSNLANSYAKSGRHDEALRLREQALAARQAVLGPTHQDTLESANNLGLSYTTFGQHEKSIELLKRTLPVVEAKFGADHVETLPYRFNLAQSHAALGQDEAAVRLYQQTLDLAKDKLSASHPNTLRIMNNLAWVLATAKDADLRDPARAVELATTAAQQSPKAADYWGTLGTARYRAGDWKQAALDLEKAIALRGPKDPVNANESFFLAMARWQLGDKAGARASFDKGVAWMDASKLRTDETRRFRAEAAALLRIEDKAQHPGQ